MKIEGVIVIDFLVAIQAIMYDMPSCMIFITMLCCHKK